MLPVAPEVPKDVDDAHQVGAQDLAPLLVGCVLDRALPEYPGSTNDSFDTGIAAELVEPGGNLPLIADIDVRLDAPVDRHSCPPTSDRALDHCGSDTRPSAGDDNPHGSSSSLG